MIKLLFLGGGAPSCSLLFLFNFKQLISEINKPTENKMWDNRKTHFIQKALKSVKCRRGLYKNAKLYTLYKYLLLFYISDKRDEKVEVSFTITITI